MAIHGSRQNAAIVSPEKKYDLTYCGGMSCAVGARCSAFNIVARGSRLKQIHQQMHDPEKARVVVQQVQMLLQKVKEVEADPAFQELLRGSETPTPDRLAAPMSVGALAALPAVAKPSFRKAAGGLPLPRVRALYSRSVAAAAAVHGGRGCMMCSRYSTCCGQRLHDTQRSYSNFALMPV